MGFLVIQKMQLQNKIAVWPNTITIALLRQRVAAAYPNKGNFDFSGTSWGEASGGGAGLWLSHLLCNLLWKVS